MRSIILGLILTQCLIGYAKEIKVKVVDDAGGPQPKVLVVVRGVSTYGETGRFLTDSQGTTPSVPLKDGLNEIIVSCPYGTCKTSIREVLSETAPSEIVVVTSEKPIEHVLTSAGDDDKVSLILQASEGGSSSFLQRVNIFVRDAVATKYAWYTTDVAGRTTVSLLSNRTIVIVPFKGHLYTFAISPYCPDPERERVERLNASEVDPPGTTCSVIARGEARLVLPVTNSDK